MASESATSIHARTCHLCEANCGVLVEVQGRKTVSIRGNPDHVLSRGHICPKATALADLQDDPDRLRRPIKRTADGWQEIDWETAFAEIGARMAGIIASGGQPALYMGNPNAHNYATGTQTGVLRKALGVRTLYSASTLDQIPHQLVQMWMYGHNALFPIPDVDRTHFMLIIGGNPLASNGSARSASSRFFTSGTVQTLPLLASGLPPMISMKRVRSTSGIGNSALCPYIHIWTS